MRNSGEWSDEILGRVYGDMVKDNKITRIADQIYILGDSLQELKSYLHEVLSRARDSGLTFKPSKVVICPRTTVILG